jgi:hypothetical protein
VIIVNRAKFALAFSLIVASVAYSAPAQALDKLDPNVDPIVLATRLTGAGAGIAVGTPIAVARETAKTYVELTNGVADDLGGRDLAPSVMLATVITGPVSILIGGAKGLIAGGRNGITHGFNAPFSLDSFSLNGLDD